MMSLLKMIVTVDVESDKSSDWRTSNPVTFRGVADGIGKRLNEVFAKWGVRPTYLLSPEVMTDGASCDLLRSLKDCELGTHLHGDYILPSLTHQDIAGTLTEEMQWEYPSEVEEAKLAVLTELFVQQFDMRPVSFRAGRFGIGPNTGKILGKLGYLIDSSVTPHITWTNRHGEKCPDFSTACELPYWTSTGGDLLRRGRSKLLELPVTVLKGQSKPVWFRPWYSDTETLCAVMRDIHRQNVESGTTRPLVMMFHNVEVIPGASPYPQSEDEVRRYLDSLGVVFEQAAHMGVRFCTMHEYYASHEESEELPQEPPPPVLRCEKTSAGDIAPPELIAEIDLDAELVEQILDRHGTSSWFKYIFKERKNRWDCWEPCHWIYRNLLKDAAILSTGTGVGFNLLWLALNGYSKLDGFDIDHKAVSAGLELAAVCHVRINLWLDDGLKPAFFPVKKYQAIEALNWTALIKGFDLAKFLSRYRGHLADRGVIIFDVIDAAYNLVPGNQFCTQDAGKPAAEKRASEYQVRLGEAEVVKILHEQGFHVEHIFCRQQEIPKKVYVARLG